MTDTDTGYEFGDAEPEDAWHPLDPADELVDNLHARLEQLGERRVARDDAPLAERLDDIRSRLGRVKLRRLEERERLRTQWLDADIEHVARRLAAGLVDSLHGHPDHDRPEEN
jgi:hypothetical protein